MTITTYTPKSHEITVRKLNHRGKDRIALIFDYDIKIINQIKTLPGRRYSASMRCWHLPYGKESYSAFLSLNIPYIIESPKGTADLSESLSDNTLISSKEEASAIPSTENHKIGADILDSVKEQELNVHWNNGYFRIEMKYNLEDVAFVKKMKRSWWSAKDEAWLVKANLDNLKAIQAYFLCFSTEEYGQIYEGIQKLSSPVTVEMYSTPQYPDKVAIRIHGYQADVAFIKSLPDRIYDQEYKRWFIPSDERLIARVEAHYSGQGAKIINRTLAKSATEKPKGPSVSNELKHLRSKYPMIYQDMLGDICDAMIREKYSISTIRAYIGQIVRYRSHYSDKAMDLLTVDDANSYLAHLAKNEASNSLMNHVYSAIKLYYDKVSYTDTFELRKMKRPRKHSYLPTILSRKEVDAMLQNVTNLKHRCMLYTLYGAGLRLAELINLKVADIYWDRNQIIVKSGKGKKDRMVMLSETLKMLLERYFDQYQPVHWLFEGQKRENPYSSSSVQHIVKRAAKDAGINKRVTPHTLRHCFATHLMDGGVDSRYIQELLGHKDIKTTLIYTHVTNRSLNKIISPLDRLNELNENNNDRKKPKF